LALTPNQSADLPCFAFCFNSQTAWNNFAVIDLKALGPGYLDESKQMIRGESTEQYKTLYANPETYLDDGFRTEDEFADFPAD
jgi:hypothetical protein